MRRAIAVIVAVLVSIVWLFTIVAVPVLATTNWLDPYVPAPVRDFDPTQLVRVSDLVGLVELAGVDPGQLDQLLGDLQIDQEPDQIGQEPEVNGEPDVVVDSPIPTDTPEPPAMTPEPPAETPMLEPSPTPTDTPMPTPTSELAVDILATIQASADVTSTTEISPPTDITSTVGITATGEITPTSPMTGTTASAPVEVTVASRGNLRAGPGTDFDLIGVIDADATVTVVATDASGEWFLLDDDTWIFGGLLAAIPDVPEAGAAEATPTPTPPTAASVITTTVNAIANLRGGPGTTFNVVGGVNLGDEVSVVGRHQGGEWYVLQDGSWISGTLLDNVDALAALPVVDDQGVIVAGENAGQPVVPSQDLTGELTGENTPTPAAETGVQPTANITANLRAGPGTNFDVVGSVATGTALEIVGSNAAGDWLQLESGEWISAPLVSNPPANLPVVEQ